MKYPNVKNAHIVPATYLRNWEIDGKIALWLVQEGKRLADQPVENVGTRRRFYERERLIDGQKINDVEWSVAQGEAAATPLLRSFDERWPLSAGEKTQLAELFAYQLLRGPRSKAEYEEKTRTFLEGYDKRPTSLPQDVVDDQNAALLSDSYRFIRMLSAALTTTSVFGSMHWTLVELERPLIATSDHPVVLWPGSESRAPQAVQVTEAGIMRCSKVRLPLSPFRAVLMTWADQADEDDVRVSGRAITLQTSTPSQSPPPIGSGFIKRGATTPPRAAGYFRPLSSALVPGAGNAPPRLSMRRSVTNLPIERSRS
jgi:Protein of unknown function (DUF4238)